MQLWCNTESLNGFNKIRVKEKHRRKLRESLQFSEPSRKPQVIYIHNALEFGTACKDLTWNHCASNLSPFRNKWNCCDSSTPKSRRDINDVVAIRIGRKLVGGFRGMLLLPATSQDRLSDGTQFERRFGEPCERPIIPFGSLVVYHPRSTKDLSRIHQFGKKALTWNIPWSCTRVNLERRHIGL